MRATLWLGHLWALPVTALGVVQALVLGAHLARTDVDGVMHFVAPARGPLAWFFRGFGVQAFTWGATITYANERGPTQVELVQHERVHVYQTMALGPLMPLAYVGASALLWLRGKRAYYDNPFEVAARRKETASHHS
jgi:hypothetical protein